MPIARPLGDVAASRLPDVTDRRTIMNEMRKLDNRHRAVACCLPRADAGLGPALPGVGHVKG